MGKSAPSPPDPKDTSAAQTGTSVSTAIANQHLGNVNEVGPDGTVSYTYGDPYTYSDPYTGKSYTVQTPTKTTTLSPEQQAIYDTTVGTKGNLADLANQQSGFLKNYMANPIDLSSGNVEKYINDHFSDDFNKQQNQQQESLLTRLANQGIGMGSEAYQNAMDQFSTQRANAYDNLYGNQYQNAVQDITAERNQPINEITALLSGSQVSQPNFTNTPNQQIPTTDTAGIINTNYQQRLAQAQANNQGVLGGLFGLGGSLLQGAGAAGGFGALFSDKRLKTDIRKIGKTDSGQALYAYRFKAGGPMQIGLIAQEVEKTRPDAVIDDPSGFKMVDYDKALATEAA